MSTDNAAKIQQALDRVDPNNTSDWLRQCRVDAQRALDALLAEHRAEVERLTRERDNLGNAVADLTPRAAIADTARDAALEEGATEATRRAGLARRVYVGTEKAPMGDGAGAALETLAADLRALKSTPAARFIPEEKVLVAIRDTRRESADMLEADERDFLRRLGMDLDAACECGHVSIGSNSLCAATIRTAGGSVAACGCSHPSHAMPAKAEPSSTERLSAMTGVPAHLIHDEPAHEPTPGVCRGCDAPEDAPTSRHRFGCTIHGARQVKLPAVAVGNEDTCQHGRWWDSPCAECKRGDVVL
jgi:hypothetical protein